MSHVIRDLRNNDLPNVDQIQGNNKQHSYYLRAKTSRFAGYGHEEEAEFKKSASLGKKFVMSPTPSHGSKSERFVEYHSALSVEDQDVAKCLVMLSNKSYALSSDYKEEINKVEKGMFQCKACKKIFNSHQALGGHRASHKKVKGCFAAKSADDDENIDDQDSTQEEHDSLTLPGSDPSSRTARKGAKMHECSVCRRVFSSGQALGGHKRCHWLTTSTDNAFIPSFQDFQYDAMFTNHHHHEHNNIRDQDHDQHLDLNLNLPAPHLDRNHIAVDNTNVFEASTRLYNLQEHHNHQKIVPGTEIDNGEKGCEVNDNKLRKLSDLKDVNLDGGWLQVGIASTTDIY
ncbi:hypothetical protein DH2020_005289 [Rehmannia glutinosa]|uniref:C2H2-type domain-containing protein n=1 Tax=Rehmannia glutinosa TaxID=99300 RepID=A0ABR0XFL0_REHGL